MSNLLQSCVSICFVDSEIMVYDNFLSFYILPPGTSASMSCKLLSVNHLNAYCNKGRKVNENSTDENTSGRENLHYLQVKCSLTRY
jgi:hypothetical protein